VGLAAISADAAEESVALADKLAIGFPLLSDTDLRAATAWGVAMQGKDIAVPATFVVLPDRRVFWKKVGESVTDRADNDEILEVVERARAAAGPAK
jgi:peroxiredoxin